MGKRMLKSFYCWLAKFRVRQMGSLTKLQLHTGSRDEYGQGFYNGLECALACLEGRDGKYLDYTEYRFKTAAAQQGTKING